MSTLDQLRDIDSKIGDWLLESRPTTEEEKEQAKRVLFLLNRLDRLRHELILEEFKLASLDLRAPTESLKALNDRMTATAKSISTANDVIDITTSVISVVAKVIVMLA